MRVVRNRRALRDFTSFQPESLYHVAMVLGLVLALAASARAATLNTLQLIDTGDSGVSGLIADAAGNLYGTTQNGGANNYGSVFKLDASNSYAVSTLIAFNFPDGNQPLGGLIADSAGDLYGTTSTGGNNGNGSGTVFKLDASNNYALSTLAMFNNANGASPQGSLVADAAGNLYGITQQGGANGEGTVFKLDKSNNDALSTLATFNGSNGDLPFAGLIADASGNLYGTTALGGTNEKGTVFKLDKSNNYALSTLTTFNGNIGVSPLAALVADAAGNLYGTTSGNGDGTGTVFKLDASNNYALTTLAMDDSESAAGLIIDAAGNLYGTNEGDSTNPFGTVFKLDASNNYALNTLVTFDGSNGFAPESALLADAAGNLYGTTDGYDHLQNVGTVFELTDTGFAVPEPSSMALLGVGGVAILRRRNSHARSSKRSG